VSYFYAKLNPYSYRLEDACEYAWDEGCVLVGAAGNDNQRGVSYPAKFDTVICVGAIDENDERCDFPGWWGSNWGPEMELVAPGVDVLSTYPTNTYAYGSGTSMAAPHVSGVAALLLSKYPELNNEEVRARLNETAVDLGDTGWDEYYGCGKINATAVLPFTPPPRPPVADFTYSPLNPKVNQTITFNASDSYDSDGFVVSYDWNFGDGYTGYGIVVNHTYTEPRYYTVTLTVTDNESLTDSKVKYIFVKPENITDLYVDDDKQQCPYANYTIIQAAIDYTKATQQQRKGGYIIHVYPGEYNENLVIDRYLTITSFDGAENTVIDSLGIYHVNSVKITEDAAGTVFSGFTIKNSSSPEYSGIRVDNTYNCSISENIINVTEDRYEKNYGLYLSNSHHCTIFDNIISAKSREDVCIYLEDSYSNSIRNNSVSSSNQTKSYGALLQDSNSNSFIENEFRYNYYGIEVKSSEHNTIRTNEVYLNKQHGIWCDECEKTKIVNNTIYSNSRYGIYCEECEDTLISENEVYSNSKSGVYIENCNGNEITANNEVYLNKDHGIYLYKCNENVIAGNNEVYSNEDNGIYLKSSMSSEISNNEIRENGKSVGKGGGIYLDNSDDSRILSNTIQGNSRYGGIYFYKSCSNLISDNLISRNKHRGIYLDTSCKNNLISANTITNNGKSGKPNGKPDDGIYIYRSNSNEISSNTIYNHTIVEVYQTKDVPSSGIRLEGSSNNPVSDCKIVNNNISHNCYGISLEGVSDVWLLENEIDCDTVGIEGIYADTDKQENSYLTISRNNVTFTPDSSVSVHGIEVRGTVDKPTEHVHVHFNHVNNSRCYGLKLERVHLGDVNENTILYSGLYGIGLDYCFDVNVWHNSLIDNTDNGYDDGANTWDRGNVTGGNYWSDYEEKYPDANCSIDGIWDKPYVIDFSSIDHYPFCSEYSWRALIIKNASTDKALYNRSEPVRISFVAQDNDGDNVDTVTVNITKPDGFYESPKLREIGTGNYKCTFFNASLGGNYNVTIRAQKRDYPPSEPANLSFGVRTAPPVAKFTYSPEFPLVNTTVTFNASESFDPDGGAIVNYEWDFGDENNTNTTEPVITHSYPEAGTYNVTLTVKDNSNTENSTFTELQVFESLSFDTKAPANPYPSIFGIHNGTIEPIHDVIVYKLYTYPCPGTGGHSEYVRIWRTGEIDVNVSWAGYTDDWHNISFISPFILKAGETYNYTLRTGSYPQIHHTHTSSLETEDGTITCEEFIDANTKVHNTNWIPAIKLF